MITSQKSLATVPKNIQTHPKCSHIYIISRTGESTPELLSSVLSTTRARLAHLQDNFEKIICRPNYVRNARALQSCTKSFIGRNEHNLLHPIILSLLPQFLCPSTISMTTCLCLERFIKYTHLRHKIFNAYLKAAKCVLIRHRLTEPLSNECRMTSTRITHFYN